ncbi:MAG TPA: HdeD family acid-resistance protein [Candidatus Udaeobacter sp.]|nr:HdeD family acid-resistance protein [Candidatus Udaeobacter sp.]
MMIETLKRHWWVPVIRGIAAIVFGVIAFTHPVMAIATLVLFFGAWVLIDGIFRVVGAIGHRASDPDWGWHIVIGIMGIIVGLLTFHAPRITALALVIYIAAWALMMGASEIAIAVKLRREIKGEWFLILMGLASIVFAVLLLWNPVAGAAALIWLIAWYAVVLGVLGIFFGFRLRTLPASPVS